MLLCSVATTDGHIVCGAAVADRYTSASAFATDPDPSTRTHIVCMKRRFRDAALSDGQHQIHIAVPDGFAYRHVDKPPQMQVHRDKITFVKDSPPAVKDPSRSFHRLHSIKTKSMLTSGYMRLVNLR